MNKQKITYVNYGGLRMNKQEFIKLYDKKEEEIILIHQQQREMIKEYLKSIGLTYGKKFKITKGTSRFRDKILKMTGDTIFEVLKKNGEINQARNSESMTRNKIESYEFELIEE